MDGGGGVHEEYTGAGRKKRVPKHTHKKESPLPPGARQHDPRAREQEREREWRRARTAATAASAIAATRVLDSLAASEGLLLLRPLPPPPLRAPAPPTLPPPPIVSGAQGEEAGGPSESQASSLGLEGDAEGGSIMLFIIGEVHSRNAEAGRETEARPPGEGPPVPVAGA